MSETVVGLQLEAGVQQTVVHLSRDADKPHSMTSYLHTQHGEMVG